MAESTLSLSIDDLESEVGAYLGYGRGANSSEPAWTTAQQNNITAVVKSGLSQFYTPPPIKPGERAHSWTFLTPFTTIVLASGDSSVALPDDFGHISGPLYVTDPQASHRFLPIKVYNEGYVQAKHAGLPDTTGAPVVAAIQTIAGTTLTEGTRYRLYVWPTADTDYTFAIEYKYLPDMLTGLLPFPPGGQQHAETIKAACIAAAELYLDDVKGPRFQFYMERLMASVEADRRAKGPNFGYNGDNSYHLQRVPGRPGRHLFGSRVTYNGSDF